MLGESPASCAFHLRTLAKYGFVEKAGGGRSRERPWRRRNPECRPADAVPVEFVLFGYPVLDSLPLPAPEPPEMSDPRGTMAEPDNRRHPPGN
jgi:hypothetical protein